ncbi:hypothetical protein B0H19DRAFT_1133045 [Mycena capillaripes]|nr:hypothetical protein B0H19DRAFT_1197699 [Mycena capillaripes]KAJ6528140.1 hypothetical protein B0H19DRAFT_1195319 [Mycena capillaripes]KAJ6559775.1 hypothetical protein B0H19DRAFT_1145788 [Mycena capillaripes]KAJ6572239.1 hypothetical protein B0H19DRAFT_1133045 [Mycena capillaripes]
MTLSMLSAFGLLLRVSTLPLPPAALFFVCPTRQRSASRDAGRRCNCDPPAYHPVNFDDDDRQREQG